MGDIVETPDLGGSNPTNDEQNPPEGDGSEEGTDDNQTPVTNEGTEGGEQTDTPSGDTDNSQNDQDGNDGVSDETGTPDVEAPAETEVPEDEASDDENASSVNNDGVVSLADEFTIGFTVTLDDQPAHDPYGCFSSLEGITEIPADRDISNLTVGESKIVTFALNLTDEQTAKVKAKVGEGTEETLEQDADSGVYTIGSDDTPISGNVTVTINIKTKTYTINAPAASSDVAWNIKKQSDTAFPEEAAKSVEVTRDAEGGAEVTLQATLPAEKPPVNITIGGETKKLEAGKSVTFDVKIAKDDLKDAGYSITATVQVIAVVTISGKGDDDKGFTVEYAFKKDNTFGDFANVTDGKIEAAQGDVIGLKITAPSGKSVKDITGGTVNENEDGIWEYTVVAPGADANKLLVELQAVKTITVTAADANAKIKGVSYQINSGSTKNAAKSGTGWTIPVPTDDGTTVTITVKAENHNKVMYIHKSGEDHKPTAETPCAGCVFTRSDETSGNDGTTTAIAVGDIKDTGLELKAATEKITVKYTFNAGGIAGAKIVKADGSTEADKEQAEAETQAEDETPAPAPVKYILDEGETYYVKVADDDLVNIKQVTATGEEQPLKLYKNGFRFEAKTPATGEAKVEIEKKVATPKTITIAYKNAKGEDPAGVDFSAKITADTYNTGNDKDDPIIAETNISADTDSPTTYTVLEGTPFSFTLTPQDENYYEVTNVAVLPEGKEVSTPLTAESGKYKIDKAEACTILVTVALSEEKADKLKFTNEDGNVSVIKADLKGADTFPTEDSALASITPGEVTRYKKDAASKKVKFKIVTNKGYEVDTVKLGDNEVDKSGTGDETVWTYTCAESKEVQDIKITTKATALTEDKYVTFDVQDENVTLTVGKEAGDPIEKTIDGEKKLVYKLTKAQDKTDTTAEVKEIPELSFELSVPHGYWLQSKSFVGDSVHATAERTLKEGSWVYSYKVVANQLTSSEAAPATVTIADDEAAEEQVTIKTAEADQSVTYKNLDDDYPVEGTIDNDGVQVYPDNRIVVTLEEGDSATLDGKACELDTFHAFSFEAKLDDKAEENGSEMVIDVTKAEAAAYVLKWTKKSNAAAEDYEVVDKTISADIGDKIYVQLFKGEDAQDITEIKEKKGDNSKFDIDALDKSKAVIEVGDENVSAQFWTETEKTVPGTTITRVEDEKAADISVEAKDGSKLNVTASVKEGKEYSLEGASVTTYPLTIKKNNKKVNAADYDNVLIAAPEKTDVAKTDIKDGKLIIEMLKGEGSETKVTISAKGQAEGESLLTFTVKGKNPALKMKKVESPNQGVQDVLVNVTADASVKTTLSDSFKYYYEIGVANSSGTKASEDIEGYYYVEAPVDAKGKLAPASQLIKVKNPADLDKATATEYKFSVSVVAKDKKAALTAEQMGTPAKGDFVTKQTVDFTGAPKEAKFKTKEALYETKLKVTKKKTKFYAGEKDVTIAIPKFSAKAGYIDDIEVTVYNKDGSLASNSGITPAKEVDPDTMEVKLDSSRYSAGSYDVVITATATKQPKTETAEAYYDMYRASAKVPITVMRSTNRIELTPVEEVYIKDYGTKKAKDASFTLKPVGVYGYDDNRNAIKAQSPKFGYDVVNFGNPANKDKVVVKNNKITVKKDFTIANDPTKNTFDVRVWAKDYGTDQENLDEDYGRYMIFTVTVTKTALDGFEVKVIGTDGKSYGNNSRIPASALGNAEVVVSKAGKPISSGLVDFTPNKGKIRVKTYQSEGYCYAYVVMDGYAKSVTIKAKSRDGGNKTASAKLNIDYNAAESFTLAHYGDNKFVEGPVVSSTAANKLITRTGDKEWTFKGGNNDKINFYIANKKKNKDNKDILLQAEKKNYNYSVKIIGGKNTSGKSNEAYGWYSIAPSAGKVEVKITEKGKPTVTFTIINDGWKDAKAPTAALQKGQKLYAAYEPYGEDYNDCSSILQDLTFEVKKNSGYTAVQLKYVSGIGLYGSNYSNIVQGVFPISNDKFTLEDVYAQYAGTAKYSAVYGTGTDETDFEPATKAANLNIKASSPGSVKLTKSYTISTNVGYSAKLTAKPVINFKNDQKLVEYVGVLSANVKDKINGKRNNFFDYFTIAGENSDRLQMTAKGQEKLKEAGGIAKDDLTGYLVYRYVNNKGKVVTKQDKITVKINDNGRPKYTATPVNVVAAASVEATTTIKLDGEPVAIAKVKAEDGSVWTATSAETTEADGTKKNVGVVTLKASTPPTGNVNIYVIPADSANKDAADAEITTKGIKVTVPVKVLDKSKNKEKLKISKTAKTPEAKILTDKTIELTATFEYGTDYELLWGGEEITNVGPADVEKLTKADEKKGAEAVKENGVKYDSKTKSFTIAFDKTSIPQPNGKTVYKVPVKITFGADESDNFVFLVKPDKDVTKKDVEDLIKDKLLKDGKFPVSDLAEATAKSEVKAALQGIEVPELSGYKIQLDSVKAKNPDKYAEDHLIAFEIKDMIAADGAADAVSEIVIEVTKKADLETEIKAAVNKWRVPDYSKTPTVPADCKEVKDSTTSYDIRADIQAAVDKVYRDKEYIVDIYDFVIGFKDAPDTPAPATKAAETKKVVASLTYKYSVKNARTGDNLDKDGTEKFEVVTGIGDAEATKIETPTLPAPEKPVDPTPGPVATVEIAAAGSATTVEAGKELKFTATVKDKDGKTIEGKTVQWSVTGGTDGNETAITPATSNSYEATLKVDASETKDTQLEVTATVDGVTSEKTTITVTEASGGSGV